MSARRRAAASVSLDHLVGAAEQRERNIEPELLCALEVEEQLHLCGKLYRQIGRLLTLQDARDIEPRPIIGIGDAAAITHDAAGGGKFPVLIDCGHRLLKR